MSQVAISSSAFVRSFLAMLVLELDVMVVRLVRPPILAGVDADRWTVRLGISVDVRCPAWRVAWLARASPTWGITMLQWREHSWTSATEIVDGSAYHLRPSGIR